MENKKKRGRKKQYKEATITRAYRMPKSIEPEITEYVMGRCEQEKIKVDCKNMVDGEKYKPMCLKNYKKCTNCGIEIKYNAT